MGEAWTDERLDDLRDSVVEFRTETREAFGDVRREMKEEFAAVREELKEGFDEIRRRMLQFMGLIFAALIVFVLPTQL